MTACAGWQLFLGSIFLTRMSSDIFVGLVPAADLTSRLTELAGEVDAYLRSDGIRLCAGIRYFSPQERTSANVACDQAKAACSIFWACICRPDRRRTRRRFCLTVWGALIMCTAAGKYRRGWLLPIITRRQTA